MLPVNSMQASFPRLCGGEISDWYTGTMVERAPTPTPAMMRPSNIMGIPFAKDCMAPPTKKIMEPYRIVRRRPMMSPIRPTQSEATKAPTSRMATMVPTSAREG